MPNTAADFAQELYEAFEAELVDKLLIESTIKQASWDRVKYATSIMLTLDDGSIFEVNVRKLKDAPETPSTR